MKRKGDHLKSVEIPRGEIFDTFSEDENPDKRCDTADEGESNTADKPIQKQVTTSVLATTELYPKSYESSNPRSENLPSIQKLGEEEAPTVNRPKTTPLSITYLMRPIWAFNKPTQHLLTQRPAVKNPLPLNKGQLPSKPNKQEKR